MSVKALRNSLIAHLAADSDIAAFCVNAFGRAHTVFNALNLADPPDESKAPYLIVETGKRQRDVGTHYYRHQIRIMVSIVEAGQTSDDGQVIFDGCDVRDDLAALVERKATLYLESQGAASEQAQESDDEVIYPWFSCCWTYQVLVRDVLPVGG